MSALTEEELLKAYYQDGDQKYLAELYQPYITLVYGLCLKYFKNTAEAEDAAMDIYLSLVKKLKKHKVTNFKSWLFVVSRNHCLDKLRSKSAKFSKESEAEVVYYEQIIHPDNEDNQEKITKLENCIEQLPDNQKKSINLFYYKKLSYKEISKNTGWTWSNIRSYIQNGRRNLKNCMEK